MTATASDCAPPVACSSHQPGDTLFTSGAYVQHFRPDADGNPFRRLYRRKLEAVLAAVGGSPRDVLDLGAGMGRMSVPLSTRHRVTMCDISVQMLRLAQPDHGVSLRRCAADAGQLPFRPASFDDIICIDLLPHLREPEGVLRELYSLLRPGGRLIVDSTNSMPLWTLAYPRYLGRRPSRWLRTWRAGGVSPEWSARVFHRRRGDFLRLLRESRFEILEERGLGPGPLVKWHLAVARRR
jgi:ubiquinone/menaquinone biosynthesis C-methylase UbiE